MVSSPEEPRATTSLPQRRRRRRSSAGEAQAVSTGQDVVVFEDGSEIQAGRRFQHPAEIYPHWEEILQAVQDEFVYRSRGSGETNSSAYWRQRENYLELVNHVIFEQGNSSLWQIMPIDLGPLVDLLMTWQFGYGALADYMKIDGLEEVYFNRFDEGFYIVTGQKKRIDDPIFRSEKELLDFVNHVATENNLEINLQKPALDAVLVDGSRLNATLPPIAVDGPDFVIRKHRETVFSIADMIGNGMISEELAYDMKGWIAAGYNIVVSGGTGSGKTTLLNALGQAFIPKADRLIVIEDTPELQIQTSDTKRFQTRRDATRGGKKDSDITIGDLIRQALRKRPDRIIIGEVRGVEAYDTLFAWNSGHDGSLLTVHANNATAALRKIEMLAAGAGELGSDAIRLLLSDSVDIVLQIKRDRDPRMKGRRIVNEVVQILNPHKFDHNDEEVSERVQQMLSQGIIRDEGDSLWVLPLYHWEGGRLVKVNEAIPLDSKEVIEG